MSADRLYHLSAMACSGRCLAHASSGSAGTAAGISFAAQSPPPARPWSTERSPHHTESLFFHLVWRQSMPPPSPPASLRKRRFLLQLNHRSLHVLGKKCVPLTTHVHGSDFIDNQTNSPVAVHSCVQSKDNLNVLVTTGVARGGISRNSCVQFRNNARIQ